MTRFHSLGGADAVALLKIDVEGYEFYVVEGARHLIRRYKPHIVMELQPQFLARMPPSWDAAAGRDVSGQERLTTWFEFLRTELNYRVLYIPWEHIKYPPGSAGYGETCLLCLNETICGGWLYWAFCSAVHLYSVDWLQIGVGTFRKLPTSRICQLKSC